MKKTDLESPANLSVSIPNEYSVICADIDEYSDSPHPEKEKILKYLKSFKYSLVSSQCITDKKENCFIDMAYMFYNDGKYEWSSSEIYHFEKYNLILDSNFANYIIKR